MENIIPLKWMDEIEKSVALEVFFMPRSTYTPEFRARVSQEYIDGIGSIQFLANKYGIGYSTLVGWINEYRIHGISAFCHKKNRTYSKELKIKCVEAVINGEGSVNDIIARYGISSRSVLRQWIKVYNANRELKDYDPKREVYMADARRKLDWEAQWECAIDPETAKRIREERKPEHEDTCSMCGKFCAVRSMNKALAGEHIDIL